MERLLNTLWFGISEPFKNKNYTFFSLTFFLVFFTLFVLIPVWAVPGNSLSTQLGIFTIFDYVVLTLLSSLSSLFITMQVYVMRQRRKLGGTGAVAAGSLGTLFAGIAGTAFCASCLAPLFAIFGIGFGGVVFALEYRWYFVVAIILLMLMAIYLTARKINKVCNSC